MRPWVSAIRNENGVVLPLALFFLVIMTTFLLAFLSMSGSEPAAAANHARSASALYAAEAGIAHARDALVGANINALLAGGGQLFNAQAFGTGNYTVTVANNFGAALPPGETADPGGANDTDGILVLTSTGTFQGATRQVQVLISNTTQSQFQNAVFADVGINMSSTSGTDSYNSKLAAYNAATAGSNGSIGTNGNITLSGSVTIKGDASAGGTVTAGAGMVSGTTHSAAALRTLPDIICPLGFTSSVPAGAGITYNAATGALSVSGGHNITLTYPAGGAYHFSSISLSGGSTLTMGGGGQHIDIYVDQTLSVSGGGIVNPTALPTTLTILACGANTNAWTVSGGSGAYFALYAPNHQVTVSGAGDIYGAIVADVDVESGGSHVHYDQALALQTTPGGKYAAVPGTWRER